MTLPAFFIVVSWTIRPPNSHVENAAKRRGVRTWRGRGQVSPPHCHIGSSGSKMAEMDSDKLRLRRATCGFDPATGYLLLLLLILLLILILRASCKTQLVFSNREDLGAPN